MKLRNRAIPLVAIAAMVASMAGIGASASQAAGTLKSGQTFYLITKDTLNPYETLEDGGDVLHVIEWLAAGGAKPRVVDGVQP